MISWGAWVHSLGATKWERSGIGIDKILLLVYNPIMRWTEKEIQILRDEYNNISTKDLATTLNRTETAIKTMAWRMGIKLSVDEKHRRFAECANNTRLLFNNMNGKDNPNWKGGRSKNNYYYKLRQIEKFPEKVKARNILYSALRSGKIQRQPCEVCGDQNGHAHHEDYSKPLDVIWLCPKHHKERHRS